MTPTPATPALLINLPQGLKVTIHANPDAADNSALDPTLLPAPISWAVDNPTSFTVSPQGTNSVSCIVIATGAIGQIGNVTLTDGTISSLVQITIVAGLLDHFAPTNDPPSA